MDFTHFNLNSPQRQKIWQAQRPTVEKLLDQIKEQVFDGEAVLVADHASRFSGLAKPNLALASDGELGGFIAVSVSPKDPDQLRILVSNGHTAARYDANPDDLWETAAQALERWMSQPRYKPSLPGTG
jgi:hypothetical protein